MTENGGGVERLAVFSATSHTSTQTVHSSHCNKKPKKHGRI